MSADSTNHASHGPEARVTLEVPEFALFDTTGEKPVEPANPDRLADLSLVHKDDFGAWIERLRHAQFHADRRSSPDVMAQLAASVKRPIDTVICSLLDSDPTACLNAALARQFPAEVVAGAMLISRIVGVPQVLFCADHRIPSAWFNPLRKDLRSTTARFISMANDYPQSDPTLLLFTLLNRRLRPGRSPIEQGVILLDAAASFSIGRRLLADEPMSAVPIAVRDHLRKLSFFVMAPLGTTLSELLDRLDQKDPQVLLRAGDLLRDNVIARNSKITGGENVIHCSAREPDINPDACIRCGWCVEACPTRVQPAVVLEAAQADDPDLADRAGIEACIECGICSYVCPSKLPLLEGIRSTKAKHQI